MKIRKINVMSQLKVVLLLFFALSTQFLFSTTSVSGSSTFTVQFSEYNSSVVETDSISIAAGSNAGEVTMTWGGVTYSGTAVGLTMFFSGSDATEQTNMMVVFTDETFSQAVATWTFVDTTTNEGGFELRRLDRSSGDLTATSFHASQVSGSTTFSSTYTDTNDDSTETGSFVFAGDGDSVGTFTDSGFVYDLFFYNRFFAFAYIDSDNTYGLFYGVFTDSTYTHYVAFDSYKYFDGVVQVGISEGSGSGSLAVSHTPSYEYTGSSYAFTYGFHEFNSTAFASNDETYQYTSVNGEILSGTTVSESLAITGQVMGPIMITVRSLSTENFIAFQLFDDSSYSNYTGHAVGHDIPTSGGRWGEFSIGSRSSGDLTHNGSSGGSSSGNDTSNDNTTSVGSNADDTFSGSSTFSVQMSEYNESSSESDTMTISAGSGAGEVELVWNGSTFTGTGSGLVLFLSGEGSGLTINLVIVFLDDTFGQAVASIMHVDSLSNGGFELARFDRSSGDFAGSNYNHTTVTGSTTYASTYTDMNLNDTETNNYPISGDGDSIGTLGFNSDSYDMYFHNRFFAFSYIDADGTYGVFYGLFEDDSLSNYIAFDAYKDTGDVVQVGVSKGSGSGSLSVSHDPNYSYTGSSLNFSYSWHEFNSTDFATNDDTIQLSSRSGEAMTGIIVGDSRAVTSQLIGPVLIGTVDVTSEDLFFLMMFDDTSYSSYQGHLIGQDNPTINGRWGEFNQGSKTSGDLTYSTTATAVTVSISGTPATEVDKNTAYTFTPTASASDSGTITYSIQNQPSWASFSTTTGTLSGTPTSAGVYSGIVITATSGSASSSLSSFSIEVIDTGSTVSISGVPDNYGVIGQGYSFTPTAVDTLEAAITFAGDNLPDWASVSQSTGTISGTPTTTGTYSSITITASNENGSASLSFDLEVVEVLTGKETVYVTVGGLSQPIVEGGKAPYQISIEADSASSLSLVSDSSARDGFSNKLLGETSGIATVSVNDVSGQRLVVSATVYEASSLDVTYSISQLSSADDYKMVTFPINLSNVTGTELFSHLQDQFGTYGQDYILYAYDGSGSGYGKLSASSTGVGAGYGYWMGVLSSDNYQVIDSAPSSLGEVQVHINVGWNIIGNPFSTRINTADIVYYKEGQSIAVESSAQSDLGHVFWGETDSGGYEALSSIGVGHAAWIYSSIDTILVFTATSGSVKARVGVNLENEPQPPAKPSSSSIGSSSSSSGGGGGGGCLLRLSGGSK